MNMRNLIALAALIATTACAHVADPTTPTDLLTSSPYVEEQATVEDASISSEADLSALGSVEGAEETEVVEANTWASLPDTTRHLLIMGTADGFSAGGPGTPCFPGKNNGSLDEELIAAGFGSHDPAELASELAKLSAPLEQCQEQPRRGYDSSLLSGMSDDHLAHYLTGAVRGYAHVKTCPEANHPSAGTAAAAAIIAATSPQSPPQLLAAALEEGCKGFE